MRSTRKVLLVNPSRVTAGTAFVMPAAPVALAGAIPRNLDVEPVVVDEAIAKLDAAGIQPGDVMAVSVLTNNCVRAYQLIREAKARGAIVISGGPHPTLLPEEALRYGSDAVVRGDGDLVFGQVLEDAIMGRIPAGRVYQSPDGKPFRVAGPEMAYPRLDLVDLSRYWTASLRSTAGCREACTFCTVPAIGGRVPRHRPVEVVAREICELYDRGIRFVLWGADNLVQVPLSLVRACRNPGEARRLEAEREISLS